MRKLQSQPLESSQIEALESRTLLASTTIGIYANKIDASETNPATSGRGVFVVSRPTGSTAAALTVKYYVHVSSTATSGSDFVTLKGKTSIPAGKRSVSFNVFPIDDGVDESTETVRIAVKPNAGYDIIRRHGTINIADNDDAAQPQGDWWDTDWQFRTPVSVAAGSHARTDQPVDHAINFTSALSAAGGSGSLITDSIRVIETSSDRQTIVNANVPFQFDEASNFNAASNASGNLVILLSGSTAANTTRYFDVYYDTAGSFTAPSVTPLISTSDNITDEGFSSVRITAQNATYYYHKAEGGFSSIVDSNGNDWVTWNSTAGSAGEFRGIPNLGPEGFHPGRDHDVTTTIVLQGPLKTTLESTDAANNKVRWEFYPNFARATIVDFNANWYFLYEGTPGGSINGNDTVVTSDGTATAIGSEWTDADGIGSANGQEWVYFRDSGVGAGGRYIYFVHNTPDNIRDTYWEMEGNMTVFGFGRFTSFPDHGTTNALMAPGSALIDTFTIGLADGGGTFNTASAQINGVYRDVATTQGTSQQLT